ncbi:hypothetical protein N480_10505 [Pseudoalteromonas luteoviolacea S2607]|uniref:Uncharacterized protein n=2 Tax=Pseudoalteromonas luteoviolacea TaxID=43657 RepID=A0A162CJB9_9GAMM|nr:hypothetical protein N480_10505 [Pseudoalteromonas luteoviolacea S2607]KZN68791.1 hypothetical protein N478_14100 [Pseudoalteromonas luteoviolacea S4060-1]
MNSVKLTKKNLKKLSLEHKALDNLNTPAVAGGMSAAMCLTYSFDSCCTVPETTPAKATIE